MDCSDADRTSRSGAPERLPGVGLKPFENIVTEQGRCAAGVPGTARARRRRRRVVRDVPGGAAGVPRPGARRERRGVAGDHRAPQGRRRPPRPTTHAGPHRRPARPGVGAGSARRVEPRTVGTPWPICRSRSAPPSSTTTWPDFRMRRSRRSSATAPMRPAAPQPTASPGSAAPTRPPPNHSPRKEPYDERHPHPSVDPSDLSRLHARLVTAADRDGLLDLAYRSVDTPVGRLLLVATDVGLVRVAYPGRTTT